MHRDLTNNTVIHKETQGVEYIQFSKLLEYDSRLTHCFTTRIGGDGELNLKFDENTARQEILKNYEKICSVIGVDYRELVFSHQVHEDTIRHVNLNNKGEGINKPRVDSGCDGMITDSTEVALITFYADCVAVIFYDPEKHVAAMSHAGWRGTVKKIAVKTIREMHDYYGSQPQDVIACIAPSIGPCCFEVDEPVAQEFRKAFSFHEKIVFPISNGKYKINLWEANKLQLIEAGLREQNIQVSSLCTACNNDVFYSYRKDKEKAGRLGAIIKLK